MNRTTAIVLLSKWSAICVAVGSMVGSAVAFFLWALERVTETHLQHSWLLFLLPFGGLVSGIVYYVTGQKAEAGNALIIEQIREPAEGIPLRMAPLVLFGTLVTHLFGGSAGREGTAVQIGSSLAGALGLFLKFTREELRVLWWCGLSAGFGAVFGTPMAGAIFALETTASKQRWHFAILPCIAASWVGHLVTSAWGIRHANYEIDFGDLTIFNSLFLAKIAFASLCFAGASILYVSLTHGLRTNLAKVIRIPWMRPFAGGCVVVLLVLALGERDYCGLSVQSSSTPAEYVTIESCFLRDGANRFSWFWKILFTSITVGSGFKGGEVTPLFFVGAALGNALAILLGAPTDLMAGLGFVAVFAGATKSPIASTILAVELFNPLGSTSGLAFVPCAAIVCWTTFACGSTSIYSPKRPTGSP